MTLQAFVEVESTPKKPTRPVRMAATPNFQREDMAAVAAAVAEAKRPLIQANYLDWIFFAPKIELARK